MKSLLKKKLTRPDYLLIAANLLPVVGVFFWDWSPQEIFLIYCLETILLGIITVLKMGIVSITRKTDTWYSKSGNTKQSGLFFILFFLLHYGIFVSVQMGMFFGVSGIGKEFKITFFNFFYKWPELISNDSLIMLLTFFFSYAYKMFNDFIQSGHYKTDSLMKVMFQPYGRIFIQQFTVIVGSMFLSFGAGKIFILVFAAIKIFFELFINYEALINKQMREAEKDSGQQ